MDINDESEEAGEPEGRFSVTDDGKLIENDETRADFEENLTFDGAD
jgi:hypothetical protein